MTVTVLTNYCKRQNPLNINYRDYNKLNEAFRGELRRKILDVDTMTIDQFDLIFKTTLSWYAMMKMKTIRGKIASSMNKTLSKAFKHWSRLKNKFSK